MLSTGKSIKQPQVMCLCESQSNACISQVHFISSQNTRDPYLPAFQTDYPKPHVMIHSNASTMILDRSEACHELAPSLSATGRDASGMRVKNPVASRTNAIESSGGHDHPHRHLYSS